MSSNDSAIPSAHDPRSASSSDVADYGEASNSATTVRPAVVVRNTTNGYVDPGVPSSSMASGSGEAPPVLGDLYADSPPRPFSRNVYEDTTSVFNMEFRDSTPRGRPQRVYGEPHYLHHGFDQENDELREMYRDAYRSGHITEAELRWHFNRIRELQRSRQQKRRFVNLANLADVQRQLMNRSSRAAGAAALESTAIVETNTGTSDSPSVVSSEVAGGTTASFKSTTSDASKRINTIDASAEDVHNTGFVASAQESPKASVPVHSVVDSTTNASTISQPADSRDRSLDLMCGNEVVTGEDAENFCVQLRFRPRNHVQPGENEPQSDDDEEVHDLSQSFAQIGITQEEDVVERIEVDDDSSQQIEASTDSSLATEVAMQQLANLLAESDDSAPASNIEGTKDDPMLGTIEDLPDYEDVVRQAQEEAKLAEMSASLANISFFVEKDSDNAIFESKKPIEAAAEIHEDAEVDGTASFAHRTSFVEDHTEANSDISNTTTTGFNKPEEALEAMEIDAETSAIDQDVEEMEIDGNVEAERTNLPQHDAETSVTVNGPLNSSTVESSNLNEEAVSSHSVLHSSAQPSPATSTQITVVQEHSNSEDNHVEVPILDISVSTQPSEQSQSIENEVQELSASITSNATMVTSEGDADTEMNQAEKEQQNQLPSKTNLQNPSQPSQLVDAEPVQVRISATFADASSNTTSSGQEEQFQELMREVSSIKKELSRLASIEMELSLIREERCQCNRAEVPLSAMNSNDQHSLDNPEIAANQHEAPEQPEQSVVAPENPPIMSDLPLRAQMYAATGFINRRRSKIRVMPGQRSRLALLLPKFKQAMLQRAKQHWNVQVPVNSVESNEQPENAAVSSAPATSNDQEGVNVESAETSEPRIEEDHGAKLDDADSEERQRPRFDGLTAKRLREILARPDTESPMPRYQPPAPFYCYDSDESLARRQREQAEIDAEMKSMDADSQQMSDGNTKDVDDSDSDVEVPCRHPDQAEILKRNDEASSQDESAVSTTPKKHNKRRLRNVPNTPCHHPRQAEIIAHLKSIYMWCTKCNLPYSKRLIMSDDEPTCPSCAEDTDEEHPEANDRNSDTANNDELNTGNASDQNEAHQEDSEAIAAGDTESMDDVSDREVERQESENEGDSLNQSVNLDEQLSEFTDIPPPPTPISISSVENVQLDYMSPPREDDDNDNNTFGDESFEKRPSSTGTNDLGPDSVGNGSTPKRRSSSNSSDDDEIPTKRPRRQLVVESSSEDEGSSRRNRRLRPLNRRIRRQLGRAMKRKKPPVKPQFGRLHHISELEGINLPRAPPVVNMEGLFLDEDTDLSADRQVLVVSGDHFQAALYECGIVVFIGFFDGASHGAALLREARLQPVILWHFSEDRIKSIAAGPNHLVMLGRSGRVYTIGCAEHGQLGVPKPKSYRLSSIRPHLLLRRVVIRGEEVTFSRILTIGNVTVAVTEEGAVYMCGEGYGYVFRRTN